MLNRHTIKNVMALSILFWLLYTTLINQEKSMLHGIDTNNDDNSGQLTFDCSDKSLELNLSAHPLGPPGSRMYIVP